MTVRVAEIAAGEFEIQNPGGPGTISIAEEADRAARSGLITHREKGVIQSQGAGSSCGVK